MRFVRWLYGVRADAGRQATGDQLRKSLGVGRGLVGGMAAVMLGGDVVRSLAYGSATLNWEGLIDILCPLPLFGILILTSILLSKQVKYATAAISILSVSTLGICIHLLCAIDMYGFYVATGKPFDGSILAPALWVSMSLILLWFACGSFYMVSVERQKVSQTS